MNFDLLRLSISADDQRLCDVPLHDNDKLFLATVEKEKARLGGDTASSSQGGFWSKLKDFLCKYFSEPDAERVVEHMREVSCLSVNI